MNVHIPPNVGLRIAVTLMVLSVVDVILVFVMFVAMAVSVLSGLDVTHYLDVLRGAAIALGVMIVLMVVLRLLNRGA